MLSHRLHHHWVFGLEHRRQIQPLPLPAHCSPQHLAMSAFGRLQLLSFLLPINPKWNLVPCFGGGEALLLPCDVLLDAVSEHHVGPPAHFRLQPHWEKGVHDPRIHHWLRLSDSDCGCYIRVLWPSKRYPLLQLQNVLAYLSVSLAGIHPRISLPSRDHHSGELVFHGGGHCNRFKAVWSWEQ